MRSYSEKTVRAILVVYFAILVLFLAHVYFRTDMQDFLNAGREAVKRDFSAEWVLEPEGEEVDTDGVTALNQGGSFVISKILPASMVETDSVYFSTSNLCFNVYVDDEPVYSYETKENLTGTGDGISYHMIGLGSKDQGKTLRIEAQAAFADRSSGRINEMQFGAEELFRYYVMRRDFLKLGLSLLMLIFGIVVIVFSLRMFKKSRMMRSLWALGLSAFLFGLWSLCDIGIPQLLTGRIYAARETCYMVLHLAGFPMIWFVDHKMKQKKPVYLHMSFLVTVISFGMMLLLRYAAGMDMHSMVGIIYFSCISQLTLLVVMLVDNENYCRQRSISSGMILFYTGAGIFVAASFVDLAVFYVWKRSSADRGSWFRIGLVVFFGFMGLQVFDWWSKEKSTLERDRFVNNLLQYITGSMDPDDKINKVLEYLCGELHADRAYIFEDMKDGTFDNTYEYCAAGASPQIDNLKGVPYEGVIDTWYEEYKKSGHVLIHDLEKYREVSEAMYQVLKPQDIHTLVTGPLSYEGEYIGFFGVDNPPAYMMEDISEIIRLLMFFLSELVVRRNYHRKLMNYSYNDQLTGVGNRRAIREFEECELDTSRPYGLVMCDINGLKTVNDYQGHEKGDELIKNVASCLTDVFGSKNVYRMGGDEFAIYVCDVSAEELEGMIKRLRAEVAEKGVHVAIGYSYAPDGDPYYNLRRIEADSRMYEEKREFYKDGNDRRKTQRS